MEEYFEHTARHDEQVHEEADQNEDEESYFLDLWQSEDDVQQDGEHVEEEDPIVLVEFSVLPFDPVLECIDWSALVS